ncbi:hypothetical protein GPALN_014670 [Globodera pallida]|nr:hypothetical protein GPALN_014670 [Globodera pallida]
MGMDSIHWQYAPSAAVGFNSHSPHNQQPESRNSLLAIAAATTVLFFTVLGALFVECNNGERELYRFAYATVLFFGYVVVVDRQSIWSTVGGYVILALIIALAAIIPRCDRLLIPKFKAIFYLHAFFGYVALLCVGIASHLGAAACLSGNDSLFILGGAFLCFVGMWALLLHEQKFLKDIKPDIFASLYGHMLIAYIGVVGNLSLVGFGGPFAVLSAAAFALYCIGMLVYRPWK